MLVFSLFPVDFNAIVLLHLVAREARIHFCKTFRMFRCKSFVKMCVTTELGNLDDHSSVVIKRDLEEENLMGSSCLISGGLEKEEGTKRKARADCSERKAFGDAGTKSTRNRRNGNDRGRLRRGNTSWSDSSGMRTRRKKQRQEGQQERVGQEQLRQQEEQETRRH